MQVSPFPLSSRPGFPATLHWTRSRVRLSLKERRMRFVNATKFHRKSGGAQPRDLQCALPGRKIPGRLRFSQESEFRLLTRAG